MDIPKEPFWQAKLLNNSVVILKEHPTSRFLYQIRELLAIVPVQDVERLIYWCHESLPWLSLMKGCGLCYLLQQYSVIGHAHSITCKICHEFLFSRFFECNINPKYRGKPFRISSSAWGLGVELLLFFCFFTALKQ